MTPLRVVLTTADQARAARLAAMLGETGHSLAEAGEPADIALADLPVGGIVPRASGVPTLLLSDETSFALDTAIAGVLPRATGASVLDAALRAVAAGLQVRPRATGPRGFAAAEEESAPSLLTPREMEILAAVGEGASNKAVARRLGISTHTVKFHLEAVFAKLDATSRAEAVAKGLRRGLIEL